MAYGCGSGVLGWRRDGSVPLAGKEGRVDMRSALLCVGVCSEVRYRAVNLEDAAAAAVGAWEACVVARKADPHDNGAFA